MTDNMPKSWRERAAEEAAAKASSQPVWTPPAPPEPVAVHQFNADTNDGDDDEDEDDTDN